MSLFSQLTYLRTNTCADFSRPISTWFIAHVKLSPRFSLCFEVSLGRIHGWLNQIKYFKVRTLSTRETCRVANLYWQDTSQGSGLWIISREALHLAIT